LLAPACLFIFPIGVRPIDTPSQNTSAPLGSDRTVSSASCSRITASTDAAADGPISTVPE
jgi:hypothetical protein